jgi:hypothetical protein
VCVLACAVVAGCSGPGPSATTDRAAPSASAARTTEQRTIGDQIASIEAAKPLMRSFRFHDGRDGGSIDFEAYFSDDTIQLVHGTTRFADGGGGEFRYYFAGTRLIGFQRVDRYPKREGPFYGIPLESEVWLAADGRVAQASIMTGHLPYTLPPTRRDWLLRQWIREGIDTRDLMARRDRAASATRSP